MDMFDLEYLCPTLFELNSLSKLLIKLSQTHDGLVRFTVRFVVIEHPGCFVLVL